MQSLLFFGILALALAQAPNRIRPTTQNGVEYIDLANPAFANIANLQYNVNSPSGDGAGAIWFTADKSNPNIWLSRFNTSATYGNDWWVEAGQTFKTGSVPPFLAFDTIGDVIYGVALPSAINNANAYDTALQAVGYTTPKGTDPLVTPVNFPGYSFYSIVMSPKKNPDNHYYGYVTGWADDSSTNPPTTGFFVGRIRTNNIGRAPTIEFKIPDDILTNFLPAPQLCYDLFTTVKKPSMWLDDKFLYIAVTGRCAFVIRVTLPGVLSKFSTALYDVTDPAPSSSQYLSSAVRDPQTNLLYIAVQNYDRRIKTQITSINLETMMATGAATVDLDTQGQATTILAVGIDGTEHNVYAFASGSTEAFRFVADQTGILSLKGVATLPENFRTIGSVIAMGNYVFFTTYRSDAVLGRLTKNGAFCPTFCGVVAFCNEGHCDCQSPWKKVYAPNGSMSCQNPKIYDVITKEKANEGAAIAFGIFFAFALIAAMVGWFLWWKGKSTSYQTLS